MIIGNILTTPKSIWTIAYNATVGNILITDEFGTQGLNPEMIWTNLHLRANI